MRSTSCRPRSRPCGRRSPRRRISSGSRPRFLARRSRASATRRPSRKERRTPPRASAPPPNPPPPLSRSEIIREGSSGRRTAARAERAERVERVERVEAAEPAPGTIRGKIAVPSGEPVAYVYVENVLAPPVKGQRKVIEQAGKKFVPGWAVVQRGTAIAFPNMDNIYHNVFSLSAGNQFDLGLYNSGGEPKAHTFSEPGRSTSTATSTRKWRPACWSCPTSTSPR